MSSLFDIKQALSPSMPCFVHSHPHLSPPSVSHFDYLFLHWLVIPVSVFTFSPLTFIFTCLTLLIPLTAVWLRCCEWVRMAVSRSNPRDYFLFLLLFLVNALLFKASPRLKSNLQSLDQDTLSLFQKPIENLSYYNLKHLLEFTCRASPMDEKGT